MKQIFTKKSHRKNRSFKTTKTGYSVPDLRKPNFNTKIIPFEKSHNAGNCEGGDPLRFFNIHSVAKFQKIEGGLFGVFNKKNFEKKQKMRNFNGSLTVPKNLKKGPFGTF